MTRILVVDRDDVRRRTIVEHLESDGLECVAVRGVRAAVNLDAGEFSAIVSHAHLGVEAPPELLRWAGACPIVLYAERPAVREVVAAIKSGASDFVDLAADPGALSAAVAEAARVRRDPTTSALAGMIGVTDQMRALFDKIGKVAPTESTVLIYGESGTGKELVARALHEGSTRRRHPMISLNCAAIPDTLIESELFGHDQGAFGNSARGGLVEAADGGTLFLDEIGELPPEAQARLLRVLQEGEVRRVGSVTTSRVQLRLIAATHRNLRKLMDEGRFREDLFYRLNVVTIHIPPLRERRGDLDALADALLTRITEKLGKPLPAFSASARKAIHDYHWPGNVRELENAIERAAILCDGALIDAEHLAIEPDAPAPAPKEETSGSTTLEEYFLNFVLENEDQMTETELAQKLGISRKSLWERRQRHGIPRKRTRRRGTRSSAS